MASVLRKVSEFLRAANPRKVWVFGQDENGQSVKVSTEDLVGDPGPAPTITIKMVTVPYGTAPSVGKAGTATAPEFTIRFPLAQNGKTPTLRNNGTHIQYRYADTEQWQNIVALDDLTLHFTDLTPEQVNSLKLMFSDLTDAEIALLQKPATDAAKTATDAAKKANYAADRVDTVINDTNDAADKARTAADQADGAADDASDAAQEARTAAENVKDGKTPTFGTPSAESLASSAPPAVGLEQTGTTEDGNPIYTFTFGIPKGEQGDKGDGLEIVAHFDTPEELRSTYPTGAAGTFEVGLSSPFDYYYWDMLSSEWRNSGQLQGPDGPPGQSGVYYGEDEPEDDVYVWIDPSGDADPNPGDGSGGYELTKVKVEEVLTGDIESHNHAAQVAEAIRLALVAVNNRINTLVGGSATSAIDTFHEIETFLQGITDVQTLTGMLDGLRTQIVALIPANAVQDAGYVHTDNNYTTGDKNKLAGIAANANNYSLPVASGTVMGGVRIGEGLKIVDGVLTLDKIPWVGTQAQYNALPASQKTTDYICFITG